MVPSPQQMSHVHVPIVPPIHGHLRGLRLKLLASAKQTIMEMLRLQLPLHAKLVKIAVPPLLKRKLPQRPLLIACALPVPGEPMLKLDAPLALMLELPLLVEL